VAAEEWGCPPWEIASGSRMAWFMRWQFWNEQKARKADNDGKQRQWKK